MTLFWNFVINKRPLPFINPFKNSVLSRFGIYVKMTFSIQCLDIQTLWLVLNSVQMVPSCFQMLWITQVCNLLYLEKINKLTNWWYQTNVQYQTCSKFQNNIRRTNKFSVAWIIGTACLPKVDYDWSCGMWSAQAVNVNIEKLPDYYWSERLQSWLNICQT